uniref:Glycosyltransferase family 8 protein n=1 Tax=Panagrolaimus sp. PS1159 TaxID=55785 RepID=A0AC35G753_9BILA
HFFSELYKSYFGEPVSIITSLPIQQRSLNSSNTYDIGILLIVSEGSDLSEYQFAIYTLKCYSKLHHYGFYIEGVNNTWKELCGQKQFMFIRHCIVSKLLHRHEWTLFLDADAAVIIPSRLIDDFVEQNKDVADLVFYDRLFNWEIAAGSYLAKNSSYSKEFLIKFANTEFILPESCHGSDNGAIHWLFVEQFFGNHTSQLQISNDCFAIWGISYGSLSAFEACCRLIMGETRIFYDPSGKGKIKLLPKGEGWVRDGWISDSKWSLDSDFMLHGWKHSNEMPKIDEANAWDRATSRFKFASWYRIIANPTFDLNLCETGKITWKWWSSFMISKNKLQYILMKKRLKARQEFFESQAQIPKYLKNL